MLTRPAPIFAALSAQLLWATALIASAPPPIDDYINFETPSVHALALSADGRQLALAHTADSSVYLFAIDKDGELGNGRRIPVGWEPTSVRFWGEHLWVVNHLSSSLNEIDPQGGVLRSIAIGQRPWDLLPISSKRACVTLDLYNELACFDADQPQVVDRQSLPIGSPRGLALWGKRLLISNFHSGNASTVIGGGITDPRRLAFPPNVVNLTDGPHEGRNPPPNAGDDFRPGLADKLPEPPPVGLIVRKDDQDRWLDDTSADWSPWVSGEQAAESGRVPGWDLVDHDVLLAKTDNTDEWNGLGGHLSTVMAIASSADRFALAGLQARNEIRFEPNLQGRFVEQKLVLGGAKCHGKQRCKPELKSLALPAELSEVRALQFGADAQLYVAARGSNRVGMLDANGQSIEDRAPLQVAEGPEALALGSDDKQLYVWSRFASTLSRIDLDQWQVAQTVSIVSPEPTKIRAGRRWLYDTELGSDNGTQSCAGCHIDGRSDRLAWDLGDPSAAMKTFDQNCVTHTSLPCPDWHPMKGPMRTQSLVDVIGHEPFHWRGDRQGLHDFTRTFTGLHGRAKEPTAAQINQLSNYLGSLSFPPNPFRDLDNSLPEALDLMRIPGLGPLIGGATLGTGNALTGRKLFTSGKQATPFDCSSCHTLPTGYGPVGTMFTGGKRLPAGPHGEAHLGLASLTGVSQVGLKIPSLRGLDQGLGFGFGHAQSTQGVGYASDGSVPTLPGFLRFRGFNIADSRAYADLIAYLLAFSGGPMPSKYDIRHPQGPPGRAVHAGGGWQSSWVANADVPADWGLIKAEVRAGHLALGLFAWDATVCTIYLLEQDGRFTSGDELLEESALLKRLGAKTVTALAVPAGHADRWLRCQH